MASRIDWRIVAGIAALLILGYCWWNWAHWQRRAHIGAGFAARVGCSCRYVEGRPIGSCKTDLAGLPGMAMVSLSDRPEDHAVVARIPFLASRSAHAVPGFGCIMDGN
jgi:hypothetical protein